jgi:nucleoside triphosphate diphosphatase
MTPSRDISRLIEIMAALRTPKTGCPWDLEQNFATIAPYTLEEAYEVADAIARDDLGDLEEELGDLLLQVVFHARMAEEQGAFDFGDVVEAITTKLIRRHPHVFGDQHASDPASVKGLWDEIKAQEKEAKAANGKPAQEGALAGVPVALPALTRALKLQSKASKVGFDWNDPRAVLRKIRGRNRGSLVCRRQSRAPPRRRSRSVAAANKQKIRAPVFIDRASIGGAR